MKSDRYIKCSYPNKKCRWRLADKHIEGYEYLDGSCYLSGDFDFRCPE